MRVREMTAQRTVPRDGALPRLLRILRRGGHVAFLIDQHAGSDGLWVNFFGRPASTTPAPAVLALRTNTPIVTGYGCRTGDGFQYEFFCDSPLQPESTGDRKQDVKRITATLNARLESYVRRFPDQWLWGHRRWRTPPAGRP